MTHQVLVVEDDRAFCELIERQLSERGYGVKSAAKVADALAALNPEIELVVTDGLLPDGTGVKLLEKLRAAGYAGRVIFISSMIRDRTSYLRLTRDLGVDCVLRKPVKPGEVAAQAERLIGAAAAPAPAPLDGDAFFEALCAAYRRELPMKVESVAVAIRTARRGADPAALADARRTVHQIRGAAGSFGLAAAGTAAGVLEDALRALSLSDAQPEAWRRVDEAWRQLKRQAAALTNVRPLAARTHGGAKLLLVSADPATVNDFRRLSGENATRAVVVRTAADALAAAHDPALDAVLIDASLGCEAARGLARQIRSAAGLKHLPVAMLGGKPQFAERISAVESGASVLIETPLEGQALREATAHLLALRSRARAKVLVVDDDEALAAGLAALLNGAGFEAAVCAAPRHLLACLERERPDLLILDHELPGASGLELCRMLRSMDAWMALPILLLTARTGLDIRVAAFKAGADDYLAKPVAGAELLARVRARLDRARIVDAQANHDPLTGLLNRRAFSRRTEPKLAEAKRGGRPLAVALLDLDHFKRVNDERGHAAGDRVLASLGALVSAGYRVEDLRARWGGEEFVLCFSGEDAASAGSLVERLLEEFRCVTHDAGERGTFRASFSAGVAAFPADGETLDDLLRAADRRLYEAKRGGRNRIAVGAAAPAAPRAKLQEASR